MATKVMPYGCGSYYVSGLSKEMAAYERSIIDGKIPCPFTVRFRFKKGCVYLGRVLKRDKIIHHQLIPLTPNGKPKIDLFRK